MFSATEQNQAYNPPPLLFAIICDNPAADFFREVSVLLYNPEFIQKALPICRRAPGV